MLFASCIVADPPEYRDPVQSRPVLDVYHASPSTLQLIVVEPGSASTIPVSVRVRSEDAGEDLQAITTLYSSTAPQVSVDFQTITASTFDNEGRTVSFPFQLPAGTQKGCRLLSMVVAHRSSFLLSKADQLDPKKADTDATVINWWVNVDPDPGQERSLVNCPIASLPAP